MEERKQSEDRFEPSSARIDWSAVYRPIDAMQTSLECDFVEHFLPRTHYRKLLDLACGSGRHALELTRRGYTVTGVDTDVRALATARATAAREGLAAHFLELDIRNIDVLGGTYDGIILFWQSFGFFVGEVQVALVKQLERLLTPRGRVILDLFNRLHFMAGPVGAVEGFGSVHPYDPEPYATMLPAVSDLPLRDDVRHNFTDPTLKTPGEVGGILANYGFVPVAACSEYSPRVAATKEHPRMQLVFQKA
jgi:SAM-dependent methyltransferase